MRIGIRRTPPSELKSTLRAAQGDCPGPGEAAELELGRRPDRAGRVLIEPARVCSVGGQDPHDQLIGALNNVAHEPPAMSTRSAIGRFAA